MVTKSKHLIKELDFSSTSDRDQATKARKKHHGDDVATERTTRPSDDEDMVTPSDDEDDEYYDSMEDTDDEMSEDEDEEMEEAWYQELSQSDGINATGYYCAFVAADTMERRRNSYMYKHIEGPY
jgi:hypothetical protein